MGMFDTLNLRRPLPDGWTPPDGTLQTKDFECVMDTLTITEEGRIVASGRPWWSNEVTQEEFDVIEKRIAETRRLLPDFLPNRSYRIVADEEIAALRHDLDFHGDMEFIGQRVHPDGSTTFCEYRARFTEGVLQRIEKLPDIEPIAWVMPTDTE
jgi:hypothetical protein